jgi:hypothetical protein
VHPPRVTRLHVLLEGWLGDDLLETFPAFVVTVEAGRRLTEAGLSGFELDDVEVERTASFGDDRDVPELWWPRVTGSARRDDIGADAAGVLVVSQRALEVLRRGSLVHADLEEAG